jgi:hypothetical protein
VLCYVFSRRLCYHILNKFFFLVVGSPQKDAQWAALWTPNVIT